MRGALLAAFVLGCGAPRLPQGLPPPEYEPPVMPADAGLAGGAAGGGQPVEAAPAQPSGGVPGDAPQLEPPGGASSAGGVGGAGP